MALKDILKKEVTLVTSEANIMEAAKLMHQKHVGAIVVVDKLNGSRGTPVGILTDRDITLALGQQGTLDPETSVKKIMSQNVIVCSQDDGISETISKMCKNGVRRVPVIDKKDQVVGIISSDDLYQLLAKEIHELSKILETELDKESRIVKTQDRSQQMTTSP